MIKATITSLALLILYAIVHPHADGVISAQGRLARIDAVLAKICYPLFLLLHAALLLLILMSVRSSWEESFRLGVALSVLVLGPLALVMIWCSIAFVPSWFDQARRARVVGITLIVSIIEMCLGIMIYVAAAIGGPQ